MKGNRTALTGYLRTLAATMSWRVALVLVLMLCVSLTEGIGLLMLLPMLQLVGLDTGGGTVGGVVAQISRLFEAANIPLTLAWVLVVFAGIMTARAALQWCEAYVAAEIQEGIIIDLRRRLYRAVSRADWLFFTSSRTSDFANLLTIEVDRVGYATYLLLTLMIQCIVLCVYIALALTLSPGVTAIAVGSGAALLLLRRGAMRRSKEKGEQLSTANAELMGSINEHFGGMKTVKSYGMEERNTQIFDRISGDLSRIRLGTSRSLADVRMWFAAGSAIVLSILVYSAIQFVQLSSAGILLLLFLFTRIVPKFSGLQTGYQQLVHVLPAHTTVSAWLEKAERAVERVSTAGNARLDIREAIRLDDLVFRYENRGDEPTLAIDELNIPARTTVAVVGPSGAGKSTLVDLMIGLITPDQGRVLVDGEPLTPDRLRALRQSIGYVPQDTFLLHDTIRANLRWATPDATDQDLAEALRLAAADEFVNGLPDGLDTLIGERGILLSGGERQRLALARALLRKPSLLILDEATSSLDSESEQRIQRAIQGLGGRMTILMIAHRLSTVRVADVIHVLEGGRIVESGSWTDLVQHRGRFTALLAAQGIVSEPALIPATR